MKKFTSLLLLVMLMLVSQTALAALPTISSGGNEVWYYLKFAKGELVVSSNGDGSTCVSASPRTRRAQLWKIEGSETDGYTITNQLGLTLNYSATTQETDVKASSNPTADKLFSFVSKDGGNYAICPKANTGQAFNCWGGLNAGAAIKFYRSNDGNAPMTFVAADTYKPVAQLPIIPYPSKITTSEGSIALNTLAGYQNSAAGDSIAKLVTDFASDLQKASGINLAPATSGKLLKLVADNTLGREAYKLEVNADGITITASNYAGFLYAFTTIRQLLPREIFTGANNAAANWSLPYVSIDDAPLMAVRGFGLDCARHFFSVDEVKKVIDAAAVYKLNRFHWHLTDDQGWRIQIPEFPKLTEVGAIRSRSATILAGASNFFDDTEYGRGCYYTLDQLKDVVAYAKARNVDILPEVDLPGHMVAAIASYPWLSCDSTQAYDDNYSPLGTPKEVRVNSGVSRDVLDVKNPKVIDFLKTVLKRVAEVFPYPYIHIGGDECPTLAWEKTAGYTDWMKEKGLTDAHDIQPWLVEELGTWLKNEYNKDVVVWNELVVKGRWKNTYTVKPVVFAYSNNTLNGNNDNVVKQTTELGFPTIACRTSPMYFDLLQASTNDMKVDAPYVGGYGDGWVNTVQNVYDWDPKAIAGNNANLVIGTQGMLWTESCTSGKEVEYQLFPRLLAVSELAWLPKSARNYTNFSGRLQDNESILKLKGLYYAPYAFDEPERTAAETALVNADSLISQSRPGEVGYPSQDAYNTLKAAADALRANQTDATLTTALNNAIAAYKAAPVTMPEEGKLYEIISASTYWKMRMGGSSLYGKNNGKDMGIHYTEQTEPEEVFSFKKAANGGFYIKNLTTGKNIVMGNANATATLSDADSTVITIVNAHKANKDYDYIPGVVNLRANNGVLYIQVNNNSGTIITGTDSTLCWPGSWRIREIKDYTNQLNGLVKKAELIVLKATPGKLGSYTQEGIDFLQTNVIDNGKTDVNNGGVSEATYKKYVDLYNQFQGMKTPIPTIDVTKTYYITSKADPTYYMSAIQQGNNNAKVSKTPCKINFVPTDGGYYIMADSALYISMAGSNRWSMAATTAPSLVFTFEYSEDGYVSFRNTNGLIGYDNPANDAALYANKTTANGGNKIYWAFTDVNVVTGITTVSTDKKSVADGIVYSIDGKIVSKGGKGIKNLSKGLYIVNGQKIVVK